MTAPFPANRNAFDLGVTADVDSLPFADNDFDVVTCFAVLYHLYAFEGLVLNRPMKGSSPRGTHSLARRGYHEHF